MVEKKEPMFKWFCYCMTALEEMVYIVVRAPNSKEASHIAHTEYAVEYIEEIYTPLEMALRKRHLAPTMIGVQPLIPWWTTHAKATANAKAKEAQALIKEELPKLTRQRPPYNVPKARTRPPFSQPMGQPLARKRPPFYIPLDKQVVQAPPRKERTRPPIGLPITAQ